jgi:hypothetical protein
MCYAVSWPDAQLFLQPHAALCGAHTVSTTIIAAFRNFAKAPTTVYSQKRIPHREHTITATRMWLIHPLTRTKGITHGKITELLNFSVTWPKGALSLTPNYTPRQDIKLVSFTSYIPEIHLNIIPSSLYLPNDRSLRRFLIKILHAFLASHHIASQPLHSTTHGIISHGYWYRSTSRIHSLDPWYCTYSIHLFVVIRYK